MIQVQPVILCGGSGTRLWPLSRVGFPKQFLVLSGNTSLFQQAISRLQGLSHPTIELHSPLVITNEEHRFLALHQAQELQQKDIIPSAHLGAEQTAAKYLLEPTGRNTAPALTLAALQALESGLDPILIVTPADQTIQNEPAFIKALQQAVLAASKDAIIILGATAHHPQTAYGYIQAQGLPGEFGAYQVQKFTEKPNETQAKEYLATGEYTWNCGIFVLKASLWIKALQLFRPDILKATQVSWSQKEVDLQNHFIRPNPQAFLEIPSESIDYAVMEKCPNSSIPIQMIPLDVGWSDLGSWDAVWAVGQPDSNGNVVHGDVVTTQTSNTLVYANQRLVSTVGVHDLIVVETADAVLVADQSKSQDVKEIVQQLAKMQRTEQTTHRKVYRPWGWYDSIDSGPHFQVKRICVNPGAKLSLQLHHHRAEHWIVIQGQAEVTNGAEVMTLNENQSTYIPQGVKHRLANHGATPLEIIEVQSGSYLGEDDIVRFEDHYGRS